MNHYRYKLLMTDGKNTLVYCYRDDMGHFWDHSTITPDEDVRWYNEQIAAEERAQYFTDHGKSKLKVRVVAVRS